MAAVTAIKLPRYVIFKGDNGYNLCLLLNQNDPFLCFHSENRSELETQEVIPVSGQQNVYMIKSVYNQRFWKRTSSNTIFANHSGMPSPENLNCLFKLVEINSENRASLSIMFETNRATVALQCLANKRYLNRINSQGAKNCLGAEELDSGADSVQLKFSEATPVKAVRLPRHVMFKGDNGNNLCLHKQSELRFNSKNRDLWGTHEVIPVRGKEYAVMIKSLYNNQFWSWSSNGWITADRSETPSIDASECVFKVVQISPYKVALQCLADSSYLKRMTSDDKQDCLKAAASDCFKDITTQLEFSEMEVIKLPRFVIFKGDNTGNVCLKNENDLNWLNCYSDEKSSRSLQEVIPVPGQLNVVMIKSLHNNQFWRWGENWIWADQSGTPGTDDVKCHFKVVQISPNVVALQSLANNNYLRRLTADNKTDCLNASARDWRNEPTAQLEVLEGLSDRRVFDVEYLWDLMDNSDMEPVVLGYTRAYNKNLRTSATIAATVTYEVDTQSTWSNATTVTAGFSMSFKAKVPLIGEAENTASFEFSNTYEFGKMTSKKQSFSSTLTVNDVPPGSEVLIQVIATKATATVPFKYKVQEKRVDNSSNDVQSAVDGIFRGVQQIDMKWVATETSTGKSKETVVKEINDATPKN